MDTIYCMVCCVHINTSRHIIFIAVFDVLVWLPLIESVCKLVPTNWILNSLDQERSRGWARAQARQCDPCRWSSPWLTSVARPWNFSLQIVGPIAANIPIVGTVPVSCSLVAAVTPTQIHHSSVSLVASTKSSVSSIPSVTISTKSTSQTLREFRKTRPTTNAATDKEQEVDINSLLVAQGHESAIQKVFFLPLFSFSNFIWP